MSGPHPEISAGVELKWACEQPENSLHDEHTLYDYRCDECFSVLYTLGTLEPGHPMATYWKGAWDTWTAGDALNHMHKKRREYFEGNKG